MFIDSGKGFYIIKNMAIDKYLDIPGSNVSNDVELIGFARLNGDGNKQFFQNLPDHSEDISYRIRFRKI